MVINERTYNIFIERGDHNEQHITYLSSKCADHNELTDITYLSSKCGDHNELTYNIIIEW